MTERERKARVRELQRAYKDAHDEIARLSKIGTDTPHAKASLRDAERAFEVGDLDGARHHIVEAVRIARRSTRRFVLRFTEETETVLDWLRVGGVDVSPANPRLSAARMELDRMAYGRAARLLVKSIESIVGVRPRFHDTLVELVMARYNLTLAESFGLNMALARKQMEDAFQALDDGDFEKARWLQWQMRKEVRKGIRVYSTAHELRSRSMDAIEMGQEMGADVGEARTLHDRGVESMEAKEFTDAVAFFEAALDLAIRAGRELVGRGV
jgi:hypothetical protein